MAGVIGGKYEVVRLLGQGGMGAVYEARHLGTGRRVAVKVIVMEALARGTETVARFEREARANGTIETQHVVQIFDTGVDEPTGSPFIAMEFLAGEDLHQLVTRLGPVDPGVVLRVTAQACIGLRHAHEAGIVHRDIKSANMFLAERDGGEVIVKLLDFGIAKVRADPVSNGEDHGLTRTGAMLGSPLYMSPEQARGEKDIDGRTDLWSLGVVMYEALSGDCPNGHLDKLGALILAICSEPARPIQERAPWVSPEIAAIVHRALAIDVRQRFQTADEMFQAIAPLAPAGIGLNRGMIAAVSAGQRAVRASRTFSPPASLTPSGAVSPTATTTMAAQTGSGPEEARGGPARQVVTAIVGLSVLAASAGSLLVYRARTREAPASAAVSAPPPPAGATAAPKPLAPSDRSVPLAVGPPGAAIEVDGVPAVAHDGGVMVTGGTGTLHKVHLVAGGHESTSEVVITETGAVPSSVVLALTPSPAAPARGRVAPSASAIPVRTSSPAAGSAPTAPTIDRSF